MHSFPTIHSFNSLRHFSVEGYCCIGIQNFNHLDCYSVSEGGRVTVGGFGSCWDSLNLWAVRFAEIYKLLNDEFAPGDFKNGVSSLCAISGDLHRAYTSITIDDSSPEVPVVFQSNNFRHQTFVWDNTKICQIRGHFTRSHLYPTLIGFSDGSVFYYSFLAFDKLYVAGISSKSSEFFNVFFVHRGERQLYTIAKYTAIGHEESSPIGGFLGNDREGVVIKFTNSLIVPICRKAKFPNGIGNCLSMYAKSAGYGGETFSIYKGRGYASLYIFWKQIEFLFVRIMNIIYSIFSHGNLSLLMIRGGSRLLKQSPSRTLIPYNYQRFKEAV